MNIRFYNAQILTKENNRYNIFHGELHIKDDLITYIGPTKNKKPPFHREINLNDNLIMPGFKNSHTHSPMTFLRSYADDLPLSLWLNNKVFPMEAQLNSEHAYTFTKIAILEYLANGITSCFDMYFHTESVARAFDEYGFRAVLCGAVNDFSQSSELLEKYFTTYNKKDALISYQLGFHAEYTTSLDLLKNISYLANKYKAPVFTHNSETKKEVKNCKKKYGLTPTMLFDSLNMFTYGGGGFHCIYFEDEDFQVFKKNNLFVVTNPASNLKLASGIAPLERFREMQIPIAIGTDGPASNNSLDMFKEMYLASTLQKHNEQNASACPGEDVLFMALHNGAHCMGLPMCDSLAVGKKADLTVIDLNRPNMQPLQNTIRNLVYSGNPSNVIMTMINGNILYDHGIFNLPEDPKELYFTGNKYLLDFSK